MPVYKSELAPLGHANHFRWNKVQVLSSTLCKEEENREIRIEFYKSMKNGKHQNLGHIITNLGLLKVEKIYNYDLMKNDRSQG